MVLVMVADIECDPIERSVIRVGFVSLFEHVMFTNEMPCEFLVRLISYDSMEGSNKYLIITGDWM